MSSAGYDCFQQVFGVSLASNAVRHCTGYQSTLQKALQAQIPGLIRTLDPAWRLSWGPVVYKAIDLPNTRPDNAWYVANHPTLEFPDGTKHNTYVVAIAGTADLYDLLEDFEVRSVISFDQWVSSGIRSPPVKATTIVPSNAYVAYGTGVASHTIITYPAPPNAVGGPVVHTLYRYLITLPSDATLIFTGHSLGGALSPTVALAFKSENILRVANVLTYPTAGPTPGNDIFVNRFSQAFPQIITGPVYRSWNTDFINTLDIVPKAWCIRKDLKPNQNMYQIPALYGTIEHGRSEVEALIAVGENNSKQSGVTYLPLNATTFTATPPPTQPVTADDFFNTALEEHIKAYENLFQVPIPPTSCPNMGLKDYKKDVQVGKHR